MANFIEMPKLSDTMTTGTLVKWLKQEGDKVVSGDMLAEVETDKATMELECFFDGTLLKIFQPAGANVVIGAPLCAVGKPGETVEAPAKAPGAAASAPVQTSTSPAEARPGHGEETPQQGRPEVSGSSVPAPSAAETARAEGTNGADGGTGSSTAPASGQQGSAGARIRISPLARKLAAEKRIDPALLTGSGPGGRIVRADVLDAEKAGLAGKTAGAKAAKTSAAGGGSSFKGAAPSRTGAVQEDKVTTVSNMRATIARRLVESKSQIPHFYLDIEVDAGPLLELRSQLNAGLEAEGVKLSVNDFVLKASVDALRRVPAVNCSWEPGPANGMPAIRAHSAAHVSFAVAIDDGLITPVIKDAHTKSLFAISSEAKSLAKQAKERKLQPAQFTGGTFCVSNLGMMGIDRFNAIINPPNAAILAVGTTVKKPVVKNDQIVIGQRMTLTLSVDHRVVDGATGATFLAALRDILEKPALLLV